MLGKVATGLAALGLIGGVGHVVYDNNGSPTVNFKTADGKTHTAHLKTDGTKWSCPDINSERAALRPLTVEMGRIQVTLNSVDMLAQPGRYNRLLDAYNTDADRYNARLRQDCTKTN